jgi:NAD(P)-dependent dehydrogenase (short-subunit alcohol dehydrogenase family)
MPAYSASKAGLLILTQLLAADLGPQGIRANYVARCGTRELMSLMAAESGDDASPNWEERIEAFTPLRRVGTADEVAGVVEFLSSAAASYVNGAVLKVDGGRSSVTQGTL